MRAKPVALVFWTPAQDRAIPTSGYYRHLLERGKAAELQMIVVCDPGTDITELQAWLQRHPMPGARVAIDDSGATYNSYWVKPGHHGMPRVLLIDRSGLVQFEGDPGFKAGVGWKPGMRTYVDDAFDKMVEKSP